MNPNQMLLLRNVNTNQNSWDAQEKKHFSFRLTRLKIAVPAKAESLFTKLSQLTVTLNLPLKSYNSPGTNEKAI